MTNEIFGKCTLFWLSRFSKCRPLNNKENHNKRNIYFINTVLKMKGVYKITYLFYKC